MIKRLPFMLSVAVGLLAIAVSVPAAAAPFGGIAAARSNSARADVVVPARFDARRSRFNARRSTRRNVFRARRSRGGFADTYVRELHHPLYGRFPRGRRSVLFNSQ